MFASGITRIVSALMAVVLLWSLTGCATFRANAALEFKAQAQAEGTAANPQGILAPAPTNQ